MKERGILFSDAMIRALREGTKTQTRRLVKPQPDRPIGGEPYWDIGGYRLRPSAANPLHCKYGAPGQRLWVREAWSEFPSYGDIVYRADFGDDIKHTDGKPLREWLRWRPSIFMPRKVSRLTLDLTDVRVQRVQDISVEDTIEEGVLSVVEYVRLWNSIHGEGSWAANPWVWCLSFARVDAKERAA